MFLSRDEIRDIDRRAIRELSVPSSVLMENAGRGCAELLVSAGVAGPVVICCGKGNNGGDGFVMARHLARVGVDVRINLMASPEELSADASAAFACLGPLRVPVRVKAFDGLEEDFGRAEWVVDALFGSGVSGLMRPPFLAVIEAINAAPAKVFAIDIPSGLDCDTGRPLGTAVRAHVTATMAALKKGFANPEAAPYLGRIHLVDIGLPVAQHIRSSSNDSPSLNA